MMVLIRKGKPYVRCAECSKLTLAERKREQKVGVLCLPCKKRLVAEAVGKYRDLVEQGTPPARLYFEFRVDLLKVLDKEYWEMLRAKSSAIKKAFGVQVVEFKASTAVASSATADL